MKLRFYNHLIMAAVALSMIVAGCKKEETMSFEVPSKSILIEVDRAGAEGTTTFTSENVSAVDVRSVAQGWEVVDINLYDKTITVKSPSMFDNDEVRSGTISLEAFTPLGKSESVTIDVAILDNPDVDYRNAPANCYVANKYDTRYFFNPYVGGNSTELDTEYIEIIWQTEVNVIEYVDMYDGVASFYVKQLKENNEPKGELKPGNALIGAYDKSGNLIWTWHVWVTSSNPEADVVAIAGRELMNINLGANCNSEGDSDTKKIGGSYGLYYQWGRRTPIPGPQDWSFSLNYDKIIYNKKGYETSLKYVTSDAENGNVEWAEKNPLSIICGNKDNSYDWIYSGHDDELWSTTTKSEHDPCPAGWRIPDSSIYANLTITATDDDMNWQEAQKMYGWHLEDVTTGATYFFTAQGRRNYLDGRLDIVNDDDFRPIPWSGYYWTASALDDGNAEAMFFDLNSETRATWNAFEPARSMRRANAMPVRCVRE
jgi:uncharacterized protein (TIGR02145 family)